MARKSIEYKTLKRLFALSGNQCAHPNCVHPIFNEEGVYIAQLCHIEAANKDAARYNEDQTDVERASFENLIFMCYRHHRESDFYTKEQMLEIKSNHESLFSETHKLMTTNMVQQICNDIDYYWLKHSSKKFINEELKIYRNPDLSIFDLLNEIEIHIEKMDGLFDFLHKSDNELSKYSDLDNFNDKEYWENPFISRNFETHSLAVPNVITHATLTLYQLGIKIAEKLLLLENSNSPEFKLKLESYRKKFDDFYDESYYYD